MTCPPQADRLLSAYRAGELAVGPVPPRGAGTGSGLGAAACLVGTLAAGVATEAPGSRRAGHGAVPTLPTWKRGFADKHGDPVPLRASTHAHPLCQALCRELGVGVQGLRPTQEAGKMLGGCGGAPLPSGACLSCRMGGLGSKPKCLEQTPNQVTKRIVQIMCKTAGRSGDGRLDVGYTSPRASQMRHIRVRIQPKGCQGPPRWISEALPGPANAWF